MKPAARVLHMIRRRRPLAAGVRSVALGIGLCIAVAGLLWLSYGTIQKSRRTSELLARQRTELMQTLLSAALNHDMSGAQSSVLLPSQLDDMLPEPPYDLRDSFARAFARFSYAESFFVWKRTEDGSALFDLFNRIDCWPPWDTRIQPRGGYPVVFRRNPESRHVLVEELLRRAASRCRFVVSDVTLGEHSYQIVAKVLRDANGIMPLAIVGFTVNMNWVRQHYYHQLAVEVSRIGDPAGFISLTIADDRGVIVGTTHLPGTDRQERERKFLPLFFDSTMLSTLAPNSVPPRPWTTKVAATQDQVFIEAQLGSTYTLLAAAAIGSVVSMLLTVRAVRARGALSAMQSDFVCTVTHELKTPLAFIRLLGETLGSGRYGSLESLKDYARLLSQEAWRLTRLIDNLLTFARINGSTQRQQFVGLEVAEIVEDALNHFRPQLAEKGFSTTVSVSSDLPRIRGDRVMLLQAIDNLVDNAIKYSADRRVIKLTAWAQNGLVVLDVTDQGVGITADDQPRVFDKFYRGRSASVGGSGLGLAIVKRIIEEHQGTVEFSSSLKDGTSVRLALPVDINYGQATADHRR